MWLMLFVHGRRQKRLQRQEIRHARAGIVGRLEGRPRLQPFIPLRDAWILSFPDRRQAEIGHAVDARHHQHIGKRELAAHDPWPVFCNRLIHAPAGLRQLAERFIDCLFREALGRAHALKQFLAHWTRLDLAVLELLLALALETVKERPIKGRDTDRADRDLFDVVRPSPHARPLDEIGGNKRVVRNFSSRYSQITLDLMIGMPSSTRVGTTPFGLSAR